VRAGWLLGANRVATSCVDLSDGLADGAWQLARASGVGVAIDAPAVPVSDAAREWFARTPGDPVQAAASGGDDYELLFTVRPSLRGRLRGVRRLLGDLPITKIGVVTKDPAAVTLGGAPMPGGYEHFGGSA
jgi:thiamine-monophosphate kinase